jgi:peptidoglycan/xylan/chitin deacetylase (PgdA/CDA1 family)
MQKQLIIISVICLGLFVTACNSSNQQDSGNDRDTKEIASDEQHIGKNSTDIQTANTPAQIFEKAEVPVLCYHRIGDGLKGDYAVSPATFEAHMKILADSGYHSILPEQLYDYLVFNKALVEKPVMITFDDSRIEHTEIAAPVMEKYGFRGVFFIMTITYNKKNYMSTDQIFRLSEAGHTIGLHSWDHTMATKYVEETDWQKQVIDPKNKLEAIVGKPVEYWAYPNGVYNHQAAEQLSKHFKLSFILSSKRDSTQALQSVRRMIVPEWTPQGLLKSMHRTFGK